MAPRMAPFPSRERFRKAVRAGNALLARHGFPQRATADALRAWLRTDTPYPNPDPADLLRVPFLVVHEIVEIDEAKRKGLRITKDVIVRHMEAINDAHRVAAEVELRIAASEGDLAYVASRAEDLRVWCDDPLLTPAQRVEYAILRDRVNGWVREARRGGPTQEL